MDATEWASTSIAPAWEDMRLLVGEWMPVDVPIRVVADVLIEDILPTPSGTGPFAHDDEEEAAAAGWSSPV